MSDPYDDDMHREASEEAEFRGFQDHFNGRDYAPPTDTYLQEDYLRGWNLAIWRHPDAVAATCIKRREEP